MVNLAREGAGGGDARGGEGEGGEQAAREATAGDRGGAERGRGEEHEEGGGGVAVVLEAGGGVEGDEQDGGEGAEEERDGEAAALAVEGGGEAEEGDDQRGAAAAEGGLEGLRAQDGEVLDGLEGNLNRRGVRVRGRELAHGAGRAPLAGERAVHARLRREEEHRGPDAPDQRARRPDRPRPVHDADREQERERRRLRAGGDQQRSPRPGAELGTGARPRRGGDGAVGGEDCAAQDGGEEGDLHAGEEAPVEEGDREEERGEGPGYPARGERAEGPREVDEGGAREEGGEDGEALAAEAEEPARREGERVGQARAAGGVAVPGHPAEGVPEGGGLGVGEVDVDVVEGDGEVAMGAPEPRSPERRAGGGDEGDCRREPEPGLASSGGHGGRDFTTAAGSVMERGRGRQT